MTEFKEKLPKQCPPIDAEDRSYDEIWRALPETTPKPEHFLSKAATETCTLPDIDPCRFASCSMFTTKNSASKILGFPKYRNGALAKLNLPVGAGLSKKKKQHVDFWAYAGFDFVGAILEIKV